MKKYKLELTIIINWLVTTFLIFVILWFSDPRNLNIGANKLLTNLTYFITFFMLQLLMFRALINTFRFTIDKLTFAKSKREKIEDSYFLLITETLIIIISILSNFIIALINFHIINIFNTNTINFNVAIFGIFISALVSYITPIIRYRKKT